MSSTIVRIESVQSLLRIISDGNSHLQLRWCIPFPEWHQSLHRCGSLQSMYENAQVASALAVNKTLVSLELSGFPDELCMAVAGALKVNSSLKSFVLVSCWSSSEVGLAFAEAITHNTVLKSVRFDAMWSEMDDVVGVAMAKVLQSNTTLESLELYTSPWMSSAIDGALVEAIKHNEWCQSFVVHAARCTYDEEDRFIYKTVAYNAITQSFEFVIHPNTGGYCCDNNEATASISELVMGPTMSSITFGFRNQHYMCITSSAFAQAILRQSSLLCLSFAGSNDEDIGMSVAEAVKHNPMLQSLEYQASDMDSNESGVAIAQAIKNHALLKSFAFTCGCLMDNTTGAAIAEAVKCNRGLHVLVFDASINRNMDDVTGVTISKAAESLPCLQAFEFACCGHNNMGDATGLATVEALEHHQSMQRFSLHASCSVMGNDTGLALACVVKHHAALESFTFSPSADMDNVCGIAIADAIKHNLNLHSITLDMNLTRPSPMDNETGVAIANAVQFHRALQSLVLSFGDNMNNDTGEAVAEAITNNANLESIFLTAFAMDHESGSAITNAIMKNVTILSLEVIGFDHNCAENLERNKAIREQMHTLARLARCSPDTGFHSLKEKLFRKKIFSFFLPELCNIVPVVFAGHA